jgi:hypothetical protein
MEMAAFNAKLRRFVLKIFLAVDDKQQRNAK